MGGDEGEGLRPPGARVVPYGVLGNSSVAYLPGAVAPEPDEDTAFVDPAGLHYIQSDEDGLAAGPSGAGGASGAIYDWLGIGNDRTFPKEVRQAITNPCMAKLHTYSRGSSQAGSDAHCIHVVGVDFRFCPGISRSGAVVELAEAYHSTLLEFTRSGRPKLRLLPISGGVFSGPWHGDPQGFSSITAEALENAFYMLSPAEQCTVTDAQLEMCVFMISEVEHFEQALSA